MPRIINIADAPYNAACDDATDDLGAINAAIAALGSGGTIIVPGPCRVSAPIFIAKPVHIQGVARAISSLNAIGDTHVLNFAANIEASIERMGVYGSQSPTAQHNVVGVEQNAAVYMTDCRFWGGYCSLIDAGCDGVRDNVEFGGANPQGYAVSSNGANWWIRCKFDGMALPQVSAFYQGTGVPGSSVSENHFDQCDFSGPFTFSMIVDDGGTSNAIMVASGSVFARMIAVNNARWVALNTAEIGANIQVNPAVPITVANSYGIVPVSVINGVKHLSNNVNIA